MSPNKDTGAGSLRLWRESLQPGTQRGGGGVQRRCDRGATRLGEPTTVTRPRNALPRARSGPTSLTRTGRPGSLRGTGKGNGVVPARGNSKSSPRTTTPRGRKLLRPKQGGPSQFRTLGAGPDVLLRQQRPYGSTLTGRGPPPLFAPPPSVRSASAPPTPARGGLPVPGRGRGGKEQGDRKKRKTGEAGGRGTGRLAQFYSFQKRRNPKEEKI